jgi:hypothetical protein
MMLRRSNRQTWRSRQTLAERAPVLIAHRFGGNGCSIHDTIAGTPWFIAQDRDAATRTA